MAKASQPSKIEIDPIFRIPEGAEDIFVVGRDSADGVNDDIEGQVSVDIFGLDIDSSEVDDVTFTDNDLGTPDNFFIESQVIRRSTGGQMVVDVVLAIDEVPGATNYEIQVVKA